MLCCNKNKFIFIKTEKTAGTSTQSIFSEFMRNDDHDRIVKIGHEEHQFAAQIIHMVGDQRFQSYLKFANVRNPFDMLASHYFYGLMLQQPYKNFDFYIHESGSPENLCQRTYDYLHADGIFVLDDFVKFEKIQDDIQRLCFNLGLKFERSLPHINPSHNRKSSNVLQMYNTSSVIKVRQVFGWYFDKFRYSIRPCNTI